MDNSLSLVLTQGDPAGIGPELALGLWVHRHRLAVPCFALIASERAMRARAEHIGLTVPFARVATPSDALATFDRALPLIDHGHDAACAPGQQRRETAIGTINSIERAVAYVQAGEAAAIVTNPIAKSNLYAAGFAYPGHTEFLAALSAVPDAKPPHPVMMIWSELLAVVPVTIHIPLEAVPRTLTTELIVETGVIVAREMSERFSIAAPRIAVAGLNPHAGENGALGLEDGQIVAPAIASLRALGIDASGPFPADTMFHARARAQYDVALTMYHDQGLIPAKTLAFDEGVNVTLGLPFIRTSPDHGTAFDIAGRGIARPDSLLGALKLASRLAAQASDKP